jgi:hypothetical protein
MGCRNGFEPRESGGDEEEEIRGMEQRMGSDEEKREKFNCGLTFKDDITKMDIATIWGGILCSLTK